MLNLNSPGCERLLVRPLLPQIWYVPVREEGPALTVQGPLEGMGSSGGGPGQFADPVGIALVPALGLFVREAYNHGRVQVGGGHDGCWDNL